MSSFKSTSMLKLIGPILLIAGVLTTIIVIYVTVTADFFEEPKYLWLLFIAFPVIFLGFLLTGVGFSKEIRQKNNELIREQMRAVAEGLSEGMHPSKFCMSCGKSIPSHAKFCPECGSQQA